MELVHLVELKLVDDNGIVLDDMLLVEFEKVIDLFWEPKVVMGIELDGMTSGVETEALEVMRVCGVTRLLVAVVEALIDLGKKEVDIASV